VDSSVSSRVSSGSNTLYVPLSSGMVRTCSKRLSLHLEHATTLEVELATSLAYARSLEHLFYKVICRPIVIADGHWLCPIIPRTTDAVKRIEHFYSFSPTSRTLFHESSPYWDAGLIPSTLAVFLTLCLMSSCLLLCEVSRDFSISLMISSR